MIDISDKSSCSGCTACSTVCNHHAITMEPDALGFYYPKVDVDKCVDCGLCDKVCTFHEPQQRKMGWPHTFLVQHKNPIEVTKSKSGGAFVVLSDVIIQRGGAVFGVQLNAEHLAEHHVAYSANARDAFRGSKYIQSNLHSIFLQIKQILKNGHYVLFSGTPCQVAGLKGFIGEKLCTNLYLVDILCHGVASPAIWKDYLKNIETSHGKKIARCIPRNPQLGWDHCIDTFIFDDGTTYSSSFFTGYVYHKWITQRMSCSVCPFTSLNRVSDITIGDAWGANKLHPEFDIKNIGSSIVLVNSDKGQDLFDLARNDMRVIPVDINKMMQPVLQHPTSLHPKRLQFEKMYSKYGYIYVRYMYLNDVFVRMKSMTYRILSKLKHKLLGQ